MSFHDYYYGLQTGAMLIGMLWIFASSQPRWCKYGWLGFFMLDLIVDFGAFGLI